MKGTIIRVSKSLRGRNLSRLHYRSGKVFAAGKPIEAIDPMIGNFDRIKCVSAYGLARTCEGAAAEGSQRVVSEERVWWL